MDKILIAEVSDNEFWVDFFPFYANTWGVNTKNDYTGLSAPGFNLESIGLTSETPVLSFQVRKDPYISVSSLSEVILNEKTFFYDGTNSQLYVHFENHKSPYFWSVSEIEIGFVIGLLRSPAQISGVFQGIQYSPRLKNTPVFRERKDDQYFGKQSFVGSRISIVNNDLRFKNFNIGGEKRRNGSFVRTRVWTGDDASMANYDDSIITYQGVIQKVVEGVDVELSLRDIRSTLITKSPNRYLNNSNYPDLKTPNKNEILPQVWGKCFSVPVLCLNENVNKDIDPPPVGGDTPEDYTFLICDTEFNNIASDSIKKVFINDTEVTISPAVDIDSNQNICTFDIPANFFEEVETDSSGDVDRIRFRGMSNVTIDVYGYIDSGDSHLIENGLEVIRSIILNNYSRPFNTVYYDIPTWTSFESSAYSVGYFLKKPLTTQQQIQELQNAQIGSFLWNEELKFSFGNDDFTEYSGEITKYEFMGQDFNPSFISDGTQVLSKFRVGYNRKWSPKDDEDQYDWNINDSNQENALLSFNSSLERDFPTLLTDITDVEDYERRILEIGGTSLDFFSFTTKWDKFNLKAGDWVLVEADFINDDYLGNVPAQVWEVTPNLSNWTVDLKLRVFTDQTFLLANDIESFLASDTQPFIG